MTAPAGSKGKNGITWGAALLLALIVFLGLGKAAADNPDPAPACPVMEVGE